MDGLSLFDKRRDQRTYSVQIRLCSHDTDSAFRKISRELQMSIFCIINVLFQRTFTILAAVITHIGWFKSFLADFLHEFRTDIITLVADTSFDSGIRPCTGCTTDLLRFTCYPVYTGIVRVIGITALEVMSILLDLFC